MLSTGRHPIPHVEPLQGAGRARPARADRPQALPAHMQAALREQAGLRSSPSRWRTAGRGRHGSRRHHGSGGSPRRRRSHYHRHVPSMASSIWAKRVFRRAGWASSRRSRSASGFMRWGCAWAGSRPDAGAPHGRTIDYSGLQAQPRGDEPARAVLVPERADSEPESLPHHRHHPGHACDHRGQHPSRADVFRPRCRARPTLLHRR